MTPALQAETEKLTRSWMQHDPSWLRDYLVATVEDPRLNLQSIFTRHFLIREICGEQFGPLMHQEYRFSAAMNWLRDLVESKAGPEDFAAVRYALARGADNAEGMEISGWLQQIFASLPAEANACPVPNYIDAFLGAGLEGGTRTAYDPVLNTFAHCWKTVLDQTALAQRAPVVEPACGSANDYRFFHQYGLAQRLDYTGFDLCDKNVQNARALFPGIRFELGNVFEIQAPDQSFDFCVVHDLFEHLSLEGLAVAVAEVCRVTRRALCVGFFQMDEIAEHVERPVEDYHWNLLSMERMKEAFAGHGFSAQAIHAGTFLHQTTGCDGTHNPEAYTFVLNRTPS